MESGVDVIVINYRTPGDMQRFIDSYEHWGWDSGVETHLWLVNVDPTKDDTRVVRGALRHLHDANGLEHYSNVGFAAAVNDAAARGNRETIAIFNADVELTPGALANCSQALQTNPDWGVLGPCQVDAIGGRITHAGIFGTPDAPQHRGWQKQITESLYDDVREAITVSGAAYFVKRSVWDELTACPIYQATNPAEGAFLSTAHYYEETWCSYHAQAHGHKVMYYGPVTVIHKWHQASEVGGAADQLMPVSRALFRNACDAHGIQHD